MKPMYKRAKIDIGLVAQALNNTNATGKYYGMQMDRKALFILLCGAMAVDKTTKIEILQAKDANGSEAKAIENASATITANTLVTEATIALATAAVTDEVEINGITFTMAAATDETAREFADAAGLVACINHPTYGVPGVIASAESTTVTVKAENPGENLVTVVGNNVAGTVAVATVEALAYVEVDVGSLDHANDFQYIAPKVTTTANTTVAVTLLRGDSRFEPTQQVGASASV